MATDLIPLNTRVAPELRDAVHEFRRQEAEIPPISEAVRILLQMGLKAAKAAKAAKARREHKSATEPTT